MRQQEKTTATATRSLIPSHVMSLPIREEVKLYMMQSGDKHVQLCCLCVKIDPTQQHNNPLHTSFSSPSRRHRNSGNSGNSGSSSTHSTFGGGRKHTPLCGSLCSGEEAMLVIGNKHLYILPEEKIPLDAIYDLIGHVAACSAPFPTLEINIRHTTNPSTSEFTASVRYVMFRDAKMFYHCVDVLRCVALSSRYMLHSNNVRPMKKFEAAATAAVAVADEQVARDDDDDDDDDQKLLVVNNRLLNFRRRREIFSSVSKHPQVKIEDYKENYGMAAEQLAAQISDLIDEVSETIV